MSSGRSLAITSFIALFTPLVTTAALIGVHWDTGELYDVSTTDASLSLIGPTGVANIGALAFAPDGRLFGFSVGPTATLYEFDPVTAAATPVGALGLFAFEGALTITPGGVAYAVAAGSAQDPQLLQIDLATGAATPVVALIGNHDINGLAWRSDGQLVGLDRYANGVVVIDPATGNVSLLAAIAAATGASGGMAAVGNSGFFSTSGSGDIIPGSNRLYRFDLFTGNPVPIGSFSPVPTGVGFTGLAIPEPLTATLLLLALGFARPPRARVARS